MEEIKITREFTPTQIERIKDALIWRRIEAERWIDGDMAGDDSIAQNERNVKNDIDEIYKILSL